MSIEIVIRTPWRKAAPGFTSYTMFDLFDPVKRSSERVGLYV